METLPPLGREILQQLPTFKTYIDILQAANTTEGPTSKACKTFVFGQNPRYQLDFYTAPLPDGHTSSPILVFFYGGGFASGDRQIPETPFYRNLGEFFACACGFDTIIPDYRLLSHGAKYPSGGEDVGLALGWVAKEYPGREVYVLANSAGGAHLATWMFAKHFDAQRQKISGTIQLRKVVFLGVPLRFFPDQAMSEQLKQYYGDRAEIKATEPTELMISSTEAMTLTEVGQLPSILTLYSQYDPDIIAGVAGEFATLWQIRGGRGELRVVEGHNHFSTVLGLGTNDAREEAWGHMVADWLRTQ